MNILALETATEQSSCAVLLGDQLFCQTTVPVLGQCPQSSEWLLPAVRALLSQTGTALHTLDAIAFGAGPGAFTGLRMACALAQGLAEGAGLPLVAVPTLAAMAHQAAKLQASWPQHLALQQVCVLLDARMGEVYAGQYAVDQAQPRLLGDIEVCAPDQLVFPKAPFMVCGNGGLAYPALRERALAAGGVWVPDVQPSAVDIAQLAVFAIECGQAVSPADAAPIYVRNQVAKTVAQRLAEGGRA